MSDKPVPVVTIDGPSGSGKGTIGHQLAKELNWHFLDSGALYRILALAAQDRSIPFDQITALVPLAENLNVEFQISAAGEHQVLLDGREVGVNLRTEECGDAASQVAALAEVRRALLGRQRAFRRPPGLVADGRDMGTEVFPDAMAKIFLTASPEERAKRRYKQLKEKGLSANLSSLIADISRRDQRDAERSVAPLRPALDAEVVDTSRLGTQEAFEEVLRIVRVHITPEGFDGKEA